jgi:hypothetical protein
MLNAQYTGVMAAICSAVGVEVYMNPISGRSGRMAAATLTIEDEGKKASGEGGRMRHSKVAHWAGRSKMEPAVLCR